MYSTATMNLGFSCLFLYVFHFLVRVVDLLLFLYEHATLRFAFLGGGHTSLPINFLSTSFSVN